MNAPARKYEVNINTLILLAGFAATAIGWGMIWGRFTGDVSAMALKYDAWIVTHEQMHKDRLATVTGVEARTDQRISAIEGEMRKYENLAYRITVQEQGSQTLARSVEELKAAVNSQSGDIRVMREILQRLDPRSSTSQ